MELKNYIELVVDDLLGAITGLQNKYCPEENISQPIICPSYMDEKNICGVKGVNRNVSVIEFDVALALTEEKQMQKGGSVALKVFSLSAGNANNTANEVVQRVTFSIPIVYPAVKTTGKVDGAKVVRIPNP